MHVNIPYNNVKLLIDLFWYIVWCVYLQVLFYFFYFLFSKSTSYSSNMTVEHLSRILLKLACLQTLLKQMDCSHSLMCFDLQSFDTSPLHTLKSQWDHQLNGCKWAVRTFVWGAGANIIV